jgi:hypothetical protein
VTAEKNRSQFVAGVAESSKETVFCGFLVTGRIMLYSYPQSYLTNIIEQSPLECEIWGFHSVEDSSHGPVSYNTLLWSVRIPPFQRNILSLSSR